MPCVGIKVFNIRKNRLQILMQVVDFQCLGSRIAFGDPNGGTKVIRNREITKKYNSRIALCDP